MTDNPFIEAKIDGNKVVGSYDVDNGLSALASAGIQAMTVVRYDVGSVHC